MGVSYKKHKEHRERPWPRYRIAIWGDVSQAWVDLAPVYYSPAMVISAGQRRHETLGDKIRVCIMSADGGRTDLSLEDFEIKYGSHEKESDHGQTKKG